VSHCDGGSEVQQASESNTTVQAVGRPVPSDGGSGIAPTRHEKTRSSPTHDRAPAPAGSPPPPRAPSPGVTQVQVGCVEHCYGTTTPNQSGLTLAQIEQLLGQLQAPSAPVATASPGDENVTQQAAAQSQNGEGSQSQVAGQTNGTVQVAGQSDASVPVAAVNQTAQGVVQLQVGCIFYCSGTRQTQQAQQSNTTMQSVNNAGAGAANTVSRVVWQVQVGCVVWCYNAVETQTAGTSDSTVVAVAPPPAVAAPPVEPGEGPLPAPGPAGGEAPATGARTRDSGGAPIQVPGPGRAGAPADALPVVGRGDRVAAASVSVLAQVGSGASLVSVATSRTVESQAARHAHHGGRRRGTRASRHAARSVLAVPSPSVAAVSSAAQPTFELAVALALALAALGLTGLCRRGVR
jgi:hypothetical protein